MMNPAPGCEARRGVRAGRPEPNDEPSRRDIPMRYLTKSRFKLALECPTKLFYTGKPKEFADCKAGDEFLEMLAEGGFQIGELAKYWYPDGIEIHSIDREQAADETERRLGEERVVLFEPAIRVGPFLMRTDNLVKDGAHAALHRAKLQS